MADTEKKTAKYRFLVDTIKEKIKNGEYEPGERMESENTLSEQFGYSRQTVRQPCSRFSFRFCASDFCRICRLRGGAWLS